MNIQDGFREVSTYEGNRPIFNSKYIKPIIGDFKRKRRHFECALLAYKKFRESLQKARNRISAKGLTISLLEDVLTYLVWQRLNPWNYIGYSQRAHN